MTTKKTIGTVFLFSALSAAAVTVKSTSMTLELNDLPNQPSPIGTVSRITSAAGAELAAEFAATPLFRLKLTRTDDFTKSAYANASDARSAKVVQEGTTVRLIYTELGEAVQEVQCTIRPDGALIRWGISVKCAPGWALENTSYPCIPLTHAIGTSGADDRHVMGSAKGGVSRHPAAYETWGAHAKEPGDLVAQFQTLYDDAAGLYYAAEDPDGHVKYMSAEKKDGSFVMFSRRCGFDTETVVQSYDIVTAAFDGTPVNPCSWHDAADLYKKWAVKQKWCQVPFRDRKDIPAWMRDAPAIVRFGRNWLSNPDTIRTWMKNYFLPNYPKTPLVMAYWGWEKHEYWITPDYFPVYPNNEAFAKLVADMRQLGGHAFPWPSGYHWTLMYDKKPDGTFVWDDRERFESIAKPHAVYTREGNRYNRIPGWLKGGHTACMCGGDPWTINWWNNDICLPLAKLGCEMIQVDQVVGGAFPPCWNKDHPHSPGEGRWKTDVFRNQLITMRETMRKVEPDSIVCFEEPNEHFNNLVGIQDYRDCENGGDEWASVFNYIYHEYLPCFQSNPRRGNRIWQAHTCADGQMPFLSPTLDDCNKEMSTIVNGDFENFSENSFHGWDKLSGYQGVSWNGRMFIDHETKHDGATAIRLEVKNDENAVQVSQNISMDDEAFHGKRKYRLSAWLKTGHTSCPNSVNFCFLGSKGPGGSLSFPKPEEGWKLVSRDFTIPAGAEQLRIMMHLSGDAIAWVDSIKLEEISHDGTTRPVVFTGRSATEKFMREWVALYHGKARDWLAYGRQIKPPRIVCDTQSYHGGGRDGLTRPAVFCNAYESLDGRKAVVLANATGVEQPVSLFRKGKRIQLRLEPDEIKILE